MNDGIIDLFGRTVLEFDEEAEEYHDEHQSLQFFLNKL
jgi:hypothetical protein